MRWFSRAVSAAERDASAILASRRFLPGSRVALPGRSRKPAIAYAPGAVARVRRARRRRRTIARPARAPVRIRPLAQLDRRVADMLDVMHDDRPAAFADCDKTLDAQQIGAAQRG